MKETGIREIDGVCAKIGTDWMLITAEKDGKVNTMTASWGGFGVLWNKKVAFVFIRPQRYTKEFVDGSSSFSLSFPGDAFRKEMSHLGSVSGRDEDKIAACGLSVAHRDGIPYIKEAAQVVFCKKLFAQPLEAESFIDPAVIAQSYPERDFHTLYVGEITGVIR